MILGINSQNHDASAAVIDGGDILWAAHSERYSRIKNDSYLSMAMINEMLSYGTPDIIAISDKPILKSLRRLYSGERPIWVNPKDEISRLGLNKKRIEYIRHHECHAAAGFYTSKFDNAAILVIDSIGELDTISIWEGKGDQLKFIWGLKYPNSIGLFYSSITDYVGLKPNEEEYILMGMAAFGKPILVDKMKKDFFLEWDPPHFVSKNNLHRGCKWWDCQNENKFDVAASAQAIIEEYIKGAIWWMRTAIRSNNLVIMGGVALNCVANSLVSNIFDNIHIMPNPGDAGNCIGAVAALTRKKLNWKEPYLGTNIQRDININAVVDHLIKGEIIGIANGRAEFGPRALGNRSLICDPRGSNVKDKMNLIKKREPFRPFAPAILSEHAADYFDMPVKYSPYMQFVSKCKYPDLFPGICHIDNTSRVQTVDNLEESVFRKILELWYEKTGCPMLLNTSLNIKGQPLVNTWEQAVVFENINGVKVF
jgi:carbamoyltransferase